MKKIFVFVFFIGVLSSCNTPSSAPAGTLIDGHEFVDLGLPSGLKWATCNVGALAPTEIGVEHLMCDPRDVRTVVNSGDFDSVQNYDVASIMWSDKWRRPHDYEFYELLKYCEWKYEQINGQEGYTVVGPNGNSIFLPMSHYQAIWSCERPVQVAIFKEAIKYGITYIYVPGADPDSVGWCPSTEVLVPKPVRPVSDYGVSLDDAKKDKMMRELYLSRGRIGSHAGREWVDMGLPSGLKWATCNIGASSPEETGDYINPCDDDNPLLTLDSIDTTGDDVNPGDGNNEANDWVLAKGDGNWGIPAWRAFAELRRCCTFSWETVNGRGGYRVTPKWGGPSIFLPAAGYQDDGVTHSFGTDGIYMGGGLLCFTSDVDSSGCNALREYKGGVLIIDGQRFCVRPVLMPESETLEIANEDLLPPPPPKIPTLPGSRPTWGWTTSEKKMLEPLKFLKDDIYEVDNFQIFSKHEHVYEKHDFESVMMFSYCPINQIEILDKYIEIEDDIFMNLEDDFNDILIPESMDVEEEEVQEEAIPYQLVEEKPSFQGVT